MRLIVMYDLSVATPDSQKEYTIFHKWLITKGYAMMQYSVYMKALSTPTRRENEVNALKKKLPSNGNVRVIAITDRQYHDMDFLRGGRRINESLNSELRRIKIEPIASDELK